jgi:hypothetical protein
VIARGPADAAAGLGDAASAWTDGAADVRRFPYPYRAMLAICSDLDLTPDFARYVDVLRYLNTTAQTSLGTGLGLEIGNSIYFDMPRGQLSYWSATDPQRAAIRTLIQSGHIDCLHSFGDCATTRAHAGRALDELARHDCALQVWVDHSVAPSNFGPDIMRGSGDAPGSPVYHADLTLAFGIRYLWRGRVTSVIGQETTTDFSVARSSSHPVASTRTVAKEVAKRLLGNAGSAKYAMHAGNRLLRDVTLRSGHSACEFIRSNPCWQGPGACATADGIPSVLTPGAFESLVSRGGVSIVYTHLGKTRHASALSAATRSALARLAALFRDGTILVATTSRLLDYWRGHGGVRVGRADHDGERWIHLTAATGRGPLRATELAGFTVYVPDARRARMFLDGKEVNVLSRNPADHTGRPSVSVPWRPLEWPEV